MPRENRKRGKKNKTKQLDKTQDVDCHGSANDFEPENKLQTLNCSPLADPLDSPFGPLDPDVRAYFRTVDDQLREWQDEKPDVNVETDLDPNEERRMFFTAALSEMHGKELQLATDPDCSQVLERMLYSMDDFVRRVFTDSLAGSWVQLVTNRFASHVCQTLFTIAADTVARETRGVLPIVNDGRGELLTMTQLVLDACQDIIPELLNLIHNAFASHVMRSLLMLLAPSQLTPSQPRSHRHAPSARSKKSASWKARHGPMKAVITDNTQRGSMSGRGDSRSYTPSGFSNMAEKFVEKIRSELGGDEVRALAVDKVSSPLLQMLLEMEASIGKSDSPGSIMDHVLAGLVTECHASITHSASPYVHALIFDTTSSHLAESIFSCCSSNIFNRLWDCYVRGNLPKLAVHPVANFVVARGVERLDAEQLRDAVGQLNSTWTRLFKTSRMGIFTAMVERAGQLNVHEAELIEVICSMLEMNTDEERKALEFTSETNGERDDGVLDGSQDARPNGSIKQRHSPFEPKTQGSILIQALLRLHEPHNHVVLESLLSLLPAALLPVAQNAISSRTLDAVFESPTIPLRFQKRLVTAFIGHFHLLVDDRIGSRVADRCWDAADPYLKEKVARSLIPQEHFLAGSHFGRFFTHRLSLPLLQRKPDQWKILQSKTRNLATDANAISNTRPKRSPPTVNETGPAPTLSTADTQYGTKRRRKDVNDGDEIDALFSSISAKKRAKGITGGERLGEEATIERGDTMLETVLGAIKTAPSESRPNTRRKKK